MSSFPPPLSPPPPPPWSEQAPLDEPAPPHQDPTPLLSTIGQVDPGDWSDEGSRQVRLQAVSVTWNLQWFLTLAAAAALPWVLGIPGALSSAVFFGIQIGSRLLGNRWITKRGGPPRLAPTQRNVVQFAVRKTLWVVILTAWAIGCAVAFGAGKYWMIFGAFMGGMSIVNNLQKAQRLGRAADR